MITDFPSPFMLAASTMPLPISNEAITERRICFFINPFPNTEANSPHPDSPDLKRSSLHGAMVKYPSVKNK
jgi:hypothetical protein